MFLVFKDDLLETLFKQNPVKHIWPKHLARDVTSRSTKSYSEHRFRIVDSASEPSHVCIMTGSPEIYLFPAKVPQDFGSLHLRHFRNAHTSVRNEDV